MKLIEALKLVDGMRYRKGRKLPGFLATGMNPLHLKSFLTAEIGLLFPEHKIEIASGLYGDLLGNFVRLAGGEVEFGILVVEFSDLDPRLGIRSSARWAQSGLSDILATTTCRASQLRQAIEEASRRVPLTVCLPTINLPPFSCVPSCQASSFEFDLRAIVQSLGLASSQLGQVRVLSSQSLDLDSPLKERHDVESDLLSGFPYQLSHASVLAASLARLVQGPLPKKGLITDLDDTLWKGILGEDGVNGISWDLDHHTQMHAFYQRFLGALASEGALIGIASKNDPALVGEALRRSDFALSPLAVFPVEAHWKPKSESVARILGTWNVGPDSVIFVDDSPLELAEVSSAFPEMECLQFPTGDSTAIYDLILRLRDQFGKDAIHDEDSIRAESIRRAHTKTDPVALIAASGSLEGIEAEITFSSSKTPADPRALELVNKTNQFNLNGTRYTEGSWQRFLLNPSSFLLMASYRDKFGPLGKISVLAGSRNGSKLTISTWVMSCRAFSRRIEYKCLGELFALFDPTELEFDYAPTERNGPIRDFLTEISGALPSPGCVASREMVSHLLESQEVMNG